MLSGDNQTTAKVIAKSVGIEHAYGDLFPEDKVDKLRALSAQFGPAAMIGDGVNDAPALAAADVGIAMGSGATDVALETASVVLMHDDLHLIVDAILHSRRTIRVIYLNIAFAILIKVIFVVFTFWGATSLWLALFADMGTTLLVIAHSLCLLRLRQPIAVTGELSKS